MVHKSNNNHEYPTPITALAAYLLCQNFKLIAIRYDEHHNGTYIFERSSDDLDDAVAAFNSGNAEVNLARYEYVKNQLLDRVKKGLDGT